MDPHSEPETHEEDLIGGNVSDGVVRIGRTVRKPSPPATGHVAAFLTHLHAQGLPVAHP